PIPSSKYSIQPGSMASRPRGARRCATGRQRRSSTSGN
ncbi:uncharacterized protein METZ01_LOCUS414497, partial [marine metagenome]